MKNAPNSIQYLSQFLLGTALLLLPLLVLPFTEQLIVNTKTLVLAMTALALVGLYGIATFIKRKVTFVVSPLTLPVAAFAGAVAISTFVTNEFPVAHLVGWGGIYLSVALILLIGTSVIRISKPTSSVISILLATNVLLFISSVLQFFGYGPAFLFNFVLPIALPVDSLSFHLAGSPFVGLQLGLVSLVGAGMYLATNRATSTLFQKLATGITVLAVLFYGWAILPGQDAQPVIAPWDASWSVAVDTLRAPRTALVGFGPQSFADAFTVFKPEWMNATETWATRFSQGSNILLSLLVTTGLLGVVSFLSIVYVLYRQRRHISDDLRPLFWMSMACVGLLLLLPPNITIVGMFGLITVIWLSAQSKSYKTISIEGIAIKSDKVASEATKTSTSLPFGVASTQLTGAARNPLIILTTLIAIGLSLIGMYGYARAYAAEFVMFQSTKAAQQEDIVRMYELQERAIRLNPYIDSFRRRFSATNLSIAAALAESENIGEAEAAQFSQLVQQAIREGRAATALNPINADNWLNLAQIYRSLIDVAEDAEQWATTSYITAIQLAPTNPLLRIELGGILYAAENFQDSIQFFQQAINLKPDLANAYYNLANAYVSIERYDLAEVAFQQTLLLLEPDSEGYIQAADELAAIKDLIPERVDEGGEAAADILNQEIQGSLDGSAIDQTQDMLNQGMPGAGIPGGESAGSAMPSIESLNTQNISPASQTIQPNIESGE